MSLEEMLRDELPLNRKERFFTGTVFPMIVCKDNFKHLHLLLSLLGVSPTPAIVFDPNETNILFFTEYSLVESAIGAVKQRFKMLPETKDTPDIVILIKSCDQKILVALEAKMYDAPTADKLNKQMVAQQKILESIRKTLSVDKDKIYHYALLPEKLHRQAPNITYPVVTWESVCKAYESVCKNDYFFNLLRLSLDMYEELVSTVNFKQNSEEEIQGEQVYKRFKHGRLDKVSMGRKGGINGDRLKKDIATGKWRTFPYETSSKKPEDINHNWFEIKDFVKLIENN